MHLRISPRFCALLIAFGSFFAFAAPTPTPVDPAAATGVAGEPATLVNLNTASVAELAKLPGVDEKTARAIIAGRPYTHIDDLHRNPKLSKTEILKIKNLVTIK